VSRTYLDWLVMLPWAKRTDEVIDLRKTLQVLDAESLGLEKAKDRIIEYLAVRKLNPRSRGRSCASSAPPESARPRLRARSRNRSPQVVRCRSAACVTSRDSWSPADLHRALPGQVIQELRRAESKNPVFILDEIDKPAPTSAATLRRRCWKLLDRSRTTRSAIHYLDVPFDLSEVLFITTANVLDPIPAALRTGWRSSRSPVHRGREAEDRGRSPGGQGR